MISTQLNPLPKATVLVVDDAPAMQRYLRQLLELDSYVVETTGSGAEAVKLVRAGLNPSVVLLDLQMPGMDGIKTLQSLRRLRPSLKFIICSGEEDPSQMRRAGSLGVYAYITKPVQNLYLSAAIRHCLSAEPAREGDEIGQTKDCLVAPSLVRA
jgi:CheY-like chemotaxis protein